MCPPTYRVGSRADLQRLLDTSLPGGALYGSPEPPLFLLDLPPFTAA